MWLCRTFGYGSIVIWPALLAVTLAITTAFLFVRGLHRTLQLVVMPPEFTKVEQ